MDNTRIHAALRAALLFQRPSRLRRLLTAHGSDVFAGALASCPPRLVAEALAHLPADAGIRVCRALPGSLSRDLRRLAPPATCPEVLSVGGHAATTAREPA